MLAHEKYLQHGGAPLVMLHGFLCCGEFFAPNIRVIKNTADVITIDLPGFGKSFDARGADSIAAMAAQTLDTLDALGCESFDLLGHSMGGMVALEIALRAPARLRKLILYATNSDGDLPERFESFAESKTRLRESGLEAARADIVATWFLNGAAHPHYPACLACSENVALDTALNALRAMEKFNRSAQLKNIFQPALIIGATHDRTYAPRRLRAMQRKLPDARIRFMQNCAHNAHLEDEKKFNALVKKFLTARD